MKLDRKVHKAYHFKDQAPECEKYKNLSVAELVDFFNYLQSVAFNFGW